MKAVTAYHFGESGLLHVGVAAYVRLDWPCIPSSYFPVAPTKLSLYGDLTVGRENKGQGYRYEHGVENTFRTHPHYFSESHQQQPSATDRTSQDFTRLVKYRHGQQQHCSPCVR
ncbi:unnamed protein product, partial [Ectocarpus sp. 4 AP-2014]